MSDLEAIHNRNTPTCAGASASWHLAAPMLSTGASRRLLMARMFPSCFFQSGGSQCSVFICGTLPSLSYSTFSCLLLRLCEGSVGASVSVLSGLPESASETKPKTWLYCRFTSQKVLIEPVPIALQLLLMFDRRSTLSNGQQLNTSYTVPPVAKLTGCTNCNTLWSHVCCVFRILNVEGGKHYLRSSPPPPPASRPQKKKPGRLSRA